MAILNLTLRDLQFRFIKSYTQAGAMWNPKNL
jgi:hypothetical protein